MSTQNSNPYSFEIETVNRCLIASFNGEISTHRYSEFRNDYNEVCRQLGQLAEKRVIIDLSQATYFGSLFIGMIVKLTVTTGHQGGSVALCGLSEQLKELMKKLLLLERNPGSKVNLAHYPTREEAVMAITSPSGS